MGAISIGLPRGSSTVQLDGRSLQNAASCLVCFLYHCYGLPTNSPHDCAIICRGCEIRREQGIRVCRRRILTRASFLAQILPLNEHGEYGISCQLRWSRTNGNGDSDTASGSIGCAL